MRVIPAIDLRDGACVQLVGGSYDDERVRHDDPVAVARGFRERGFVALHVVDLDAALGKGSNAETIARIVTDAGARGLGHARRVDGTSPGLDVQVGGGVRDAAAVEHLLAIGVARVIVGTRAIEDPEWLAATARAHPGRLVVAADVRGTTIVTRGWTATTALDVCELAVTLSALPLAGILVTAVHREGRMQGVDLELTRAVVAASTLPVQIAGGIGGIDDLRALAREGVHAAIVGMAIYTGALDAAQVAAEFATGGAR